MRRKRYIATIELVTVHRFTEEILLCESDICDYTDDAYLCGDYFDWKHEILTEAVVQTSVVQKSRS
jgi:hypothetical protein